MQYGGPSGTRHEGFKGCTGLFAWQSHKSSAKTIPRGFPTILDRRASESGSPRKAVGGNWPNGCAPPDHPLDSPCHGQSDLAASLSARAWSAPPTISERARRTADASGVARSFLAARFVESGLVGESDAPADHAVVGLSTERPSGCRPCCPGIRTISLFGRMNRLAVSRRRRSAMAFWSWLVAIDTVSGGPAFTGPGRTHGGRCTFSRGRTGPTPPSFGRLFDRADPGSFVDRRANRWWPLRPCFS